MTHPRRYLIRMAAFLGALAAGLALLQAGLRDGFMANPGFNGVILGVLLLGIVYVFRIVAALGGGVAWLENFRARQGGGLSVDGTPAPGMLAPMAVLAGELDGPFRPSPAAARSLLDGVFSRLAEAREISRYLIGLLIFLGLLGTFWGLLKTIGSVGDVIASLRIEEGGNLENVFTSLKTGLQSPMAGMATAFSSSLFGLAGSLVLGFLDLQAGQAQNRFFNELEDWMSGQAGAGEPRNADGQPAPAYIQGLLEQTASNLENLERAVRRGEEARAGAGDLVESVGAVAETVGRQQPLLSRLADAQLETKAVLEQIAALLARPALEDDAAEVRKHLSSIDGRLARLLDDQDRGRRETVEDIRNEIRILSRTLAAAAERPRN